MISTKINKNHNLFQLANYKYRIEIIYDLYGIFVNIMRLYVVIVLDFKEQLHGQIRNALFDRFGLKNI